MASLRTALVTRQSFVCPFFGSPKELSGNLLPTYEDLLLSCLEEKYKRSVLLNPKHKRAFSFVIIAQSVATQLIEIYRKASIPTVSNNRVVQLITCYYNSYLNLKKSYNRDNGK